MAEFQMTIDGKAVAAPQSFGVIDPSQGKVFAQAPECSRAQLDAAMESAAQAFRGWRRDEARRPLHHAPDLDAVLSLELGGGVLRLFDVVAREIPPLAEILARIPAAPARVEVYFAPDQLAAPELRAEPHVLHGSEVFMVRGPFPEPKGPFMLPRTGRH